MCSTSPEGGVAKFFDSPLPGVGASSMKSLPASSSRRPMMDIENLEPRQLMTITASLVPVTMPASAVAADATLANYKILDLQVTLSPGDHWIATDLDAKLITGSFYNVTTAKGGNN